MVAEVSIQRLDDLMYASSALSRGLDTLQLLRANGILFSGQYTRPASELVVTTAECVAKETIYTGPCTSCTPYRTGWDASLPCACDDGVGEENRVLNCAHPAPPP